MKNKLKTLSPQFRKVLKLSSSLADSLKYKIYLVGGVVRDLLLDKEIFDLDIVVEGDAIKFAKELAKILGEKFARHHSFGTATVCFSGHKIDVSTKLSIDSGRSRKVDTSTKLSIDPERNQRVDFATARTEKYAHWGALPKVKPSSLTKDLLRRDFTINAMAISLNRDDYGKLIDLFDGWQDLRKGLIRVLHPNSFLDDPTRLLRAIRFEQRFNFKIEKETFVLAKDAIAQNALKHVSLHRLRDEITLILKEPKPSHYIKRIKELTGFSFIDKKIRLGKEDFKFFLRVEKATRRYKKKFTKHRILQVWLIYLAGILIKLSSARIKQALSDFAFKKGERAIVLSIKNNLNKIKRLNKHKKPHIIYRSLEPHSFEGLIFFYAYYSNKTLRKNIDYFLSKLVNVRLKVQGRDLKAAGFKPLVLYNKILRKLLYLKLDKGFKSKGGELSEAARILKRLKR